MGGIGTQKQSIGRECDRNASDHSEEVAIGEKTGSLIVVVGHFRRECRTRDLVEAYEDSDDDRDANEIEEQCISAPVRRIEQQVIREPYRDGGRIHQGMPPAERRSQSVGDLAYDWVDKGVDE